MAVHPTYTMRKMKQAATNRGELKSARSPIPTGEDSWETFGLSISHGYEAIFQAWLEVHKDIKSGALVLDAEQMAKYKHWQGIFEKQSRLMTGEVVLEQAGGMKVVAEHTAVADELGK